MQKITPFLWFDGKAEEAARFYTGIFPRARVSDVRHYGEAGPGPAGAVMSLTFELDGQSFIALNGGPQFQFTPAISFFVSCETQEEVDDLWAKLGEGGRYVQCGWLTDKFGVSWQIVPRRLGELLADKDAARSRRVMEAMFKMIKLDIEALERAYDAKEAAHV
jgi:predicted 3-demethylubiquinone-9 3-methyltransferase (glyoxalase superfamily)